MNKFEKGDKFLSKSNHQWFEILDIKVDKYSKVKTAIIKCLMSGAVFEYGYDALQHLEYETIEHSSEAMF